MIAPHQNKRRQGIIQIPSPNFTTGDLSCQRRFRVLPAEPAKDIGAATTVLAPLVISPPCFAPSESNHIEGPVRHSANTAGGCPSAPHFPVPLYEKCGTGAIVVKRLACCRGGWRWSPSEVELGARRKGMFRSARRLACSRGPSMHSIAFRCEATRGHEFQHDARQHQSRTPKWLRPPIHQLQSD